jgi:3',5'-cyclic AMP phosphodiesterase CpdA
MRRYFFFTALILYIGSISAQSGKLKTYGKKFSFVQINDTHIKDTTVRKEIRTYALTTEKLQKFVQLINLKTLFDRPSFVIIPGDLIHGEAYEALLPDYNKAKKILDELLCPYYPILGNHEVIQDENDPRALAAYSEVFGADKINYTYLSHGILFICINNSGYHKNTKERNKWLSDIMRQYPRTPKIIAAHVPLLPMRDEKVLVKSFGFGDYYKDSNDTTLNIIRANSKTVIAVLSGHLHLTGMVKDSGIYHIVNSGLGSLPCDFTYYEVYKDHIDVKTCQLDTTLRIGSRNLHGMPRHKIDFTDSLHTSGLEYISGKEYERNFTIPLPKSKRPK